MQRRGEESVSYAFFLQHSRIRRVNRRWRGVAVSFGANDQVNGAVGHQVSARIAENLSNSLTVEAPEM